MEKFFFSECIQLAYSSYAASLLVEKRKHEYLSKSTKHSLREVCENTGFRWLIFSRVKSKFTILCSYGEMRVSKDSYSRIFNAMIRKLKLQEMLIKWIKSFGWILLFTRCIRVLLLEIPWSILFVVVTHVMSLLFFYTPWKFQKVSGFFMFSEGIEKSQWHKIG